MSCINRQVGNAPVEPGFAQVQGRPKWAIPWMEDDPSLTSAQLWAGRMRNDAADALAYGCTGLMGIHWRTPITGPQRLGPGPGRLGTERLERACRRLQPARPPTAGAGRTTLPAGRRFLRRLGGSPVRFRAPSPGRPVFTRLDCHLPRPVDWMGGPGSINPDPRPWAPVRNDYTFIDDLAALRPLVTRPGTSSASTTGSTASGT